MEREIARLRKEIEKGYTVKENAPDTPLGDLFRQVKEKVAFPQNISRAMNMTNNARIAAVHRSTFPVSDREATNVLFGATNLTMWYSTLP